MTILKNYQSGEGFMVNPEYDRKQVKGRQVLLKHK